MLYVYIVNFVLDVFAEILENSMVGSRKQTSFLHVRKKIIQNSLTSIFLHIWTENDIDLFQNVYCHVVICTTISKRTKWCFWPSKDIAKLSPAQSNSNSVGWAKIALISTFTHPFVVKKNVESRKFWLQKFWVKRSDSKRFKSNFFRTSFN